MKGFRKFSFLIFFLFLFFPVHAGFIEDTKGYAFSFIELAYFDHFDREGMTRNGWVNLPLMAYSFVGFNIYSTFNTDLIELGAQVPIVYSRKVILIPGMHSNFEHNGIGFTMQCVLKLR